MNFYGYKFEEVLEMQNNQFEYLYHCMMKAKATERVNNLQLHIYPHVKQDAAKKIHKSLYEAAMPESAKKERVITMDDLKQHGFTKLASKG